MSLLFPGRNLKTFRRFLDPHFSPTEVYVVSVNLATDLVPRSRFDGSMTKKGEGGGRERGKQDLAKFDCVGQNLAHASTAHTRSLTCFQVYSQYKHRSILRCVLLFKKNAVL